MAISSLEDITAQLKAPAAIALDCGSIARGIDNYHSDVEISAEFTFKVKESIDVNIKNVTSGRALLSGNSDTMIEVRDAYTDLMKVTLHRSKTDLSLDQISVLQFAIVKFIIEEVRAALERYEAQLEETLGQQQFAGSRSLLVTQEKMTWFRKHHDQFNYRLIRLYLRQLQREENNHLKPLRQQVLGGFADAAHVLCNPLLAGRSPRDPLLLMDHYAVWPNAGQDFESLNEKLETAFAKHLPDQRFVPLRNQEKLDSAQSEVYDELGGLFAAQLLLGPSENQKDDVHETFSWLDHPGNIRLLFDEKVHERQLNQAKDELSFTENWGFKGDLKKLLKIGQELRKILGDTKALRLALASYALKDKLTQADLELVEVEDALSFVAGNDARKVTDIVDSAREGGAALQAKLEDCLKDFDKMFADSAEDLFLRYLTDYCRYRLHLRYYRFAHRIFNRLTIIADPQKIQLAKAGGKLYELMTRSEVKDVGLDETPEIVHHTILKADVRGSTTVTAELMKQELNPASYFSLRFFNPINDRLGIYGATKVFIEGDAVILATYEYNNSPDAWFSVSHACGIAKEMLDIVASKNAHSKQTGLPLLEIGIGICYSGEKPLFLFDDGHPIMISSAIGDADRMSSCSWRMRENYDPGNFHVGVVEMADDDALKGEKGQQLIRYNVNGIVIDDAAFAKLSEEVSFKRLKAKSNDREEVFYVGQYPDVQGKERDLVVREGKVGVLKGNQVELSADTHGKYYEVLGNGKFSNQIVELAKRKG